MTADEFIARYMKTEPFYHFTDVKNLSSIAKHGLLSFDQLRQQGIAIPAPGGNDWSHQADERLGLHKYVHLCLRRQHPMEFIARQDGRIGETALLRIEPDVLKTDGVLFTPDVSNKSGVKMLTIAEACEAMDFEVVYDYTPWKDPAVQERLRAANKFELLIPTSVSTQLISGF